MEFKNGTKLGCNTPLTFSPMSLLFDAISGRDCKTEGLLQSAQPDVIIDSNLCGSSLLREPLLGLSVAITGSLKKALSGNIIQFGS